MRKGILLALVAGGLLAGAAMPAWAQPEGQYETVGPVPEPHSQEQVVMEEYLNFTCPHCNNFRKAFRPVEQKYGDRLQHVHIPIMFRGQSDAPLRLFYIAQREGLEREVKNAIFDATFTFGVNVNDPSVVGYLARSAGLGEAWEQQRNAEWVDEKIARGHAKADQVGVEATPTVVIEGGLRVVPRGGMDAFVNNLDGLIGQLLQR